MQENFCEEGFNSSGSLSHPEQQKVTPGPFTRDLLLAGVPTVNLGGVAYRQSLLDISEVTARVAHPFRRSRP